MAYGNTASRVLVLALLIAMLGIRMADPVPLQILRLKTFDIYQLFVPPKPGPEQVVVVDIDEKSLNELGQWPWSRSVLAEIVDRLTKAGAVAVGLDILFPEHDRTSPDKLADVVQQHDAELAGRLRTLKTNDQVFAESIARSRVVIGQAGFHKELQQWHAAELKSSTAIAVLGPDPAPYIDSYPGIVRNVPELEAAAAGRGMVTIRPDTDGIIRKLPMLLTAQGVLLPSLGLEMLRVATGQSTILVKVGDIGVTSVVLAGVTMPTDRKGRAWLHFRKHTPQIFVSAADVLSGTADNRIFQGRIVLVGTSATGLFDLKATPVDPSMPGVEAHAQLINAVLSQRLLSRPDWALGLEVSLTLLVGLVMIALLPRLGALVTVLAGAVIAAGVAGTCWWAFATRGLVLDYAFPLLTSLAVTGLMIVLGYVREEIDRRRIRTAFGQYLSKDMVSQLAENPDRLTLGGETRPMTILFSDVRGFTTISETFKSNPQGLTRLINSLLTPLSEAVVAHKGTIDKYMGDNIMAFWNAPLPDEDHAFHACAAALDMTGRLEKLNTQREAAGDIPLEIGVGINTGECVVGNMGSDFRFDYTVLGDAVNLASRLEGQTKPYGVKIIAGQATADLAAERFALLHIDRIRVKGKSEPEQIYALVGNLDVARSDAFKALLARHGDMLAAYYAGNWRKVKTLARACIKLAAPFELEDLYHVYIERAAEYAKAPPGKNWDGVTDKLTKD